MELAPADTLLFYDLFFKLIDYTNEKYRVVPGLTKASGSDDVSPEDTMPVRDKLWESDVIGQIIADNPLGFAGLELSLVSSWNRRLVGDFIIFRHLKKYSVFMLHGNLYGVVGMVSPIEEVFPSFILPLCSKAVLLPFEDKIIYDSLFFTYRLTFGSGIRENFNDEYRELKKTVGVITSL